MKTIYSLIAASAAIGYLHAQAPSVQPAPPARQLQEGGLARPQPRTPADTITEEQRTALIEISKKMRKEQMSGLQKLGAARMALDRLSKAENIDEKAIQAKALEIGEIEGELAIIRAKHYRQMRAAVPGEQFDRLQALTLQHPPQFEQRLNRIVNKRTDVPPAVRPGPPGSRPGPDSAEEK
jgi:Spy/CpxP family protein refolding chaperone